jgi:chaperonin cofactor prefoldin
VDRPAFIKKSPSLILPSLSNNVEALNRLADRIETDESAIEEALDRVGSIIYKANYLRQQLDRLARGEISNIRYLR